MVQQYMSRMTDLNSRLKLQESVDQVMSALESDDQPVSILKPPPRRSKRLSGYPSNEEASVKQSSHFQRARRLPGRVMKRIRSMFDYRRKHAQSDE